MNAWLHVTQTSAAGLALIHGEEQCRLAAYQDVGGIWTIGWGTTRYPDGRRVAKGDICSASQAQSWFAHDLRRVEFAVDTLVVDAIQQREFDALVSFVYNVGEPGFAKSTLRRMVNANPEDPGIRAQFMRWHYDNVDSDPALEPVEGLWNRRHREADFYFGTLTPRPPFPHA